MAVMAVFHLWKAIHISKVLNVTWSFFATVLFTCEEPVTRSGLPCRRLEFLGLEGPLRSCPSLLGSAQASLWVTPESSWDHGPWWSETVAHGAGAGQL